MTPIIDPFNSTKNFRMQVFDNLFYTDKMKIEREQETTDPDTNLTSQSRTVVVEEQICRMSINGYPTVSKYQTHKESSTGLKVFARPDTDLREGDFITLTRNGNTETNERQVFLLIAGKPLIYDSHMEVLVTERKGV